MEKAKVTSEVIVVKGKAMRLKTSNNEVKGTRMYAYVEVAFLKLMLT